MFRTTTRHALVEDGPVLRLQTPVRHYHFRAATLGLLLPFLLGLLVVLVALLELLEVGSVGPLTAVVGGIAVLGTGVALPFAVGMAVMAPRLSARSAVVIDRTTRTITPREGEAVSLDRVVGLSLRKPTAMLKWLQIQADIEEAPSTVDSPYRAPASRSVVLVSRINELEAEAGRQLMAELGERLGVEVSDRTSSLMGGGGATGTAGGRGGHALAYVPVQGIFLFASIFLLVARRGDARATFHARQSLLMLAAEAAIIVVVCIVGLPLLFLSELTGGTGPHPAGIAVLLVGLLPFTMVRLVGRFYAAWRAWKGELWLVPVLGRISRRWLPAEA